MLWPFGWYPLVAFLITIVAIVGALFVWSLLRFARTKRPRQLRLPAGLATIVLSLLLVTAVSAHSETYGVAYCGYGTVSYACCDHDDFVSGYYTGGGYYSMTYNHWIFDYWTPSGGHYHLEHQYTKSCQQ